VIAAAPGEIVAVVGPPGAGKTAALQRAVAATQGAAFVPAGRHIFASLTVGENLVLGAYRSRRNRALVAERLARVHERFPRLAERATQRAGTLSGGEQQLLVIARALMGDPSLLVLDEPTAGLGPPAVRAVAEALERVGAVLFAEPSLALARTLAHRIVLLDAGEIALDAPREAALKDARLADAFMRAPT
jgi:branched-chain amino acid transport system ATP-binding protein